MADENNKHMCPIFTAQAGEPKKCLKESCSWWMLKDRNCAFVVTARALRNLDEEGNDIFYHEPKNYIGYIL